ncbi:DNA topoisomerase IB [Kribbella qitaiheensis]|uniref:DNA topoisomerase n=1 Tax=Kribbella qitaiheensis TaxID=1544730 RepID=A0A7G6WS74_9ACTN|nr:DNA topoisomerase IB [Kribbella qitaiheensis]QNE16839.1 DNA topoisomerase IB [Kribbella qitaiheensis]
MRLRRSDPAKPGLTRRGRGKGFGYLDADGNVVDDAAVVERIRALVIPPAWNDVWICPHHNGHIQAVGTDEAGRRQYLYHDEWRTSQDDDKHDRVKRLAARLPEFRAAVDRDLCTAGLGRARVLATALRMLDHGVFRIGNTRYAEDAGSRGAATLLRDDVRVRKGLLVFDFIAKGGKQRTLELKDDKLAAAVSALRRSKHDNPRLLVFHDKSGWHEIDASSINARFQELVGDQYTVKDLRTWTATVHAAVDLAEADPPQTERTAKKAVKEMLTEVSEHLGNTPTVARASYVDPRVIAQYEEGRTIARAIKKVGSDELERQKVREKLDPSVARLVAEGGRQRK